MTAQRVAYRRLAQSLVGSLNALASSAGIAVRGAGDEPWSIRPRLPDGPYERRLTLDLRIGGGTHRAHLDAAAVDLALGDLAGAVPFDTLDGDLQAAVLEEALAEPLAALGRSLSAELVLTGTPRVAEAAGTAEIGLAHMLLDVHDPSGRTLCAVLFELGSPLPPATIEAIAATANRRDCADVPIPVTFELGQTELSGTDLRALAPGDIVLFDHCYLIDDHLRVDFAGRFQRMGTLAGTDLSISPTDAGG